MPGPQENPPKSQPSSSLEEKKLIKEGDEAPLDKGNVQPLNPGEEAKAATERLTTEYVAKGRTEADRAKLSVAKAVDSGRKGGLKIS